MLAAYTLNPECKGIEITFDSKPAADVRALLKENGFRWHKVKHLWYAKDTDERRTFAEAITSGRTAAAPEIDTSSWGGSFDACGGYMGGSVWRGSKSAHSMYGAELNRAIREDLRAHGITGVSLRKGGYNHISVTITATGDDFTPEGAAEYNDWGMQINQYAIEKYAGKFSPGFLKKIMAVNDCVNSYRYDDSNAMVDYFNSNFYYSITVKRGSR